MDEVPPMLPIGGTYYGLRAGEVGLSAASAVPREFVQSVDTDEGVVAESARPRHPFMEMALPALAGAVVACFVTVGGIAWLAGRDDPRLLQLTERNADLARQLHVHNDKLRLLETGSVAAGEVSDRLASGLTAQDAKISAVKATMDQIMAFSQLGRDEQAGISVPGLFAVAVLQLRDAVKAGRTFEWELVNLRGIAGQDVATLAQINRLAPLAANGVATDGQLVDDLRALNQAETQSGRASLLAAGIDTFARVLRNVLTSVAPTANPQLVTRASSRLEAGDYGGMARELAALSGAAARDARALVEATQRRAVAEDAVEILAAGAREGLRQQMRSSMSAPEHAR